MFDYFFDKDFYDYLQKWADLQQQPTFRKGRFWGSVNHVTQGDPRWLKRPPPIWQTLVIAPNDPTHACTQDILYFRLLAKA